MSLALNAESQDNWRSIFGSMDSHPHGMQGSQNQNGNCLTILLVQE